MSLRFLRAHSIQRLVSFAMTGMGLATASGQSPDPAVSSLSTLSLPAINSPTGNPARFEPVFMPLRTAVAALSPDGRYLAYTMRSNNELYLYIVTVDQPEVLTAKVRVLNDREATPLMQGRGSQRTPARIRWLRWVTQDRLVFETNRVFPQAVDEVWHNATGEITAINADGSDPVVLASPQKIRAPLDVRVTSTATDFAADDAAADAPVDLDPETEDLGPIFPPSAPPASLRVIGLHPTDQSSIVVRTEGTTFKVFDIDVTTGARTLRAQEITRRGTQALLDAWGRPRISIANTYRADFPRAFLHSAPGALGLPKPLDTVIGTTGFSVSPQNYFGQRAVPLGFDDTGDVLYYASNVGRNTYGVYAFDLTLGSPVAGTLESNEADLYDPTPGTFGEATSFGFSANLLELGAIGAEAETPEAGAFTGLASLDRDLGSDPDPNRHRNPALVIDRYSRKLVGLRYEAATRTAVWLHPELQAVQTWLAQNRPGRTTEIVDWDITHRRILVLERGPSDAGGYYLIDQDQGTLVDFARRAPDRDAGRIARVIPFALALPHDGRIDGVLALPTDAKLTKIPLVVLCPNLPWERRGAEYSPEFDALTRMGFAVLQINGRGTWGEGIHQREQLQSGYEDTQIADHLLAIDQLATRYPISAKRVALYGQGHGGFVALRALQEHPKRFRGAVTVDALIDLQHWLDTAQRDQASFGAILIRDLLGDETRLHAAPLKQDADRITRPVFTLAYRGETDAQRIRFLANRRLYSQVRRNAGSSEFFELQPEHINRLPPAMAEQFARIETFLNEVLYDYEVDIGDTEVVEEP